MKNRDGGMLSAFLAQKELQKAQAKEETAN
jgi:hypothetical protein